MAAFQMGRFKISKLLVYSAGTGIAAYTTYKVVAPVSLCSLFFTFKKLTLSLSTNHQQRSRVIADSTNSRMPEPLAGKFLPSRAEQLAKLKSPNKVFDVLVIGGGATGTGVALDAATRGR